MKHEEQMVVDAVITWVNGNDSAHKAKMNPYISDKKELNSKKTKMRYGQVNEIEFVVKSIVKNAKFVRNIFIVTDNQTPLFLKDEKQAKKDFPNVFIVDHKTIFEGYNQYLPTFNSLSIESLLYKIPGLSEHFIYFNDDFLLLKETKISDFFVSQKPVLRGFWTSFHEDIWYKKAHAFLNKLMKKKETENVYKHNRGQQKIAKLLGFKKYIKLDHTVAPMRKSTFAQFHSKQPELLEINIKHRFRHPDQYTNQSLACHIEIKNNHFVLKKDYQLVYFQNYSYPLFWIKYKLNKGLRDKNKLFLCIQSLDQCPQEKLNYIKQWLEERYN